MPDQSKISPTVLKKLRESSDQVFHVIVQLKSLEQKVEKKQLSNLVQQEMRSFLDRLEELKRRGEQISYIPYETLSGVYVRAYRDVIMKLTDFEEVLKIIDSQALSSVETHQSNWGSPSWAEAIVKALALSPKPPSLKWLIGDSDFLQFVGEGTYAMVVRVRNQINQEYAVKLLINMDARKPGFLDTQIRRAGPEAYVEQWERECQKLLSDEVHKMMPLNGCRFVVPYVGCGKGEIADSQLFPVPLFYLVTKFIEDHTLEEFSARPLVPSQCLEIAIQLLRAIDYATTQLQKNGKPIEIIHRDIDFDNVAVRAVPIREGLPSLLQIVVLDYGVAKIQERTSHGRTRSVGVTKRPTLPWETWFLDETGSYPFGVFTDTYSVGMILLELLFSIREENSATRAMPAPTFHLQSLRTEGLFNLNQPLDQRKENFRRFLNMYLPHIYLTADEARGGPQPPTQQLRAVLGRALGFESNERYCIAREMLSQLNTIRINLFYQQAQQWLQTAPDRYEAEKLRQQMAMYWDSPEDERAWYWFGVRLFQLHDETAAYECFSEAIRIATQANRPFPEAYRKRAELRRLFAQDTLFSPIAELENKLAAVDAAYAEKSSKT